MQQIKSEKKKQKRKTKNQKREKNSWQIANSELASKKWACLCRVDVCDMGAKLGLFELKKLRSHPVQSNAFHIFLYISLTNWCLV